MKESFFWCFWHVGTKDVLHVLFQTNLKPNDSDVKHYSHVKHSFFLGCSRNTGVRETQSFDVKHCIDVEHSCFQFCMFSHVCMFS